MSLEPKFSSSSSSLLHTTPFSVSDILSPLEESYRLQAVSKNYSAHLISNSTGGSDCPGSPPSPYHHLTHLTSTSTGAGGQGGIKEEVGGGGLLSSGSVSPVMNPSSSPYAMHSMPHPQFPQYCNGP